MSFFFCKDVLKLKSPIFKKIYFREAIMTSKLLKKGDFIIAFAVLCSALLSFFMFGATVGGETVTITENGKTVYSGSLYVNRTVTLKANTVRIKNGGVTMVSADCKNQICVKTGEIRKKGESIVCLPEKVTAEIK